MSRATAESGRQSYGAVRSLLGTHTLKATVDGAFDEVIALERRRRALLAERGHEQLSDMAEPDARQAAWG
jgi:hypothetical protein